MDGISKVYFEFLTSLADEIILQKWDELRRKVRDISHSLHAGATKTKVRDDLGDVFGIYYGLTMEDGFNYAELRDWAERIKTRLVTADGVMKVALYGTQTEVVNVFIPVNKLAGMGINPAQISQLLL